MRRSDRLDEFTLGSDLVLEDAGTKSVIFFDPHLFREARWAVVDAEMSPEACPLYFRPNEMAREMAPSPPCTIPGGWCRFMRFKRSPFIRLMHITPEEHLNGKVVIDEITNSIFLLSWPLPNTDLEKTNHRSAALNVDSLSSREFSESFHMRHYLYRTALCVVSCAVITSDFPYF